MKRLNRFDRFLTWVRHLSERYDLIQQDPEGPNVRLDGKAVFVDGLRSGPLDGELCSFFGLVNILILFLDTK